MHKPTHTYAHSPMNLVTSSIKKYINVADDIVGVKIKPNNINCNINRHAHLFTHTESEEYTYSSRAHIHQKSKIISRSRKYAQVMQYTC